MKYKMKKSNLLKIVTRGFVGSLRSLGNDEH